jgi:hypothetical protein
VGLGGAGHSDRLVESNVDLPLLGANRLAVDANLIAFADARPQGGKPTIASNPAGVNPLIRLAPRTDAGFADVLVEPQRDAWN